MSKFKEAFAKARKAGKKVFTFGGKKFTTETKDDIKKTAAKSASRLKQNPRKTKPKASNTKKSGMTNGDTKKESPKPVKAKGTTSKSKMTNGDKRGK